MADFDFDVAIIGGGPGGYVAAIRAGQLGLRTALVEQDELGGICLNWGCIPSKALLKNAEVLNLFHRSEEFGITVDNLQYDFGKAIDRSRGVVRRLTAGVGMLLRKNKVEHVNGRGRLADAHTVDVDDGARSFTAANVIVATGARPRPVPGLEVDGDTIIGSREALELRDVPSPVGIVGGGATGVEFAYLYRAYGAEVTIVEMMPRLIPSEDEEMGQQLERAFSGQGIKTLTGSRVTSVEKRPEGAVLSVETPDGARELEVQKVLVAVGVQGNVEGLGLEELGARIERGFVQVDDRMSTGVPGVYAIGDVTGQAAAGPRGAGAGRAGGGDDRRHGQPDAGLSHDAESGLLPASGDGLRLLGERGLGSGLLGEGRAVSVPGQRQVAGGRRLGGHGEGGGGRRHRRDTGRAHDRRGGDGDAAGARHDQPAGGQRERAGLAGALASHAVGGDQGGSAGRGGSSDPHLSAVRRWQDDQNSGDWRSTVLPTSAIMWAWLPETSLTARN